MTQCVQFNQHEVSGVFLEGTIGAAGWQYESIGVQPFDVNGQNLIVVSADEDHTSSICECPIDLVFQSVGVLADYSFVDCKDLTFLLVGAEIADFAGESVINLINVEFAGGSLVR